MSTTSPSKYGEIKEIGNSKYSCFHLSYVIIFYCLPCFSSLFSLNCYPILVNILTTFPNIDYLRLNQMQNIEMEKQKINGQKRKMYVVQRERGRGREVEGERTYMV